MILFRHELKRGRLSWIIWTAILTFMLGVCVLIYPAMKVALEELSTMFAEMEGFTAEQMGLGNFLEYFAVECGEVMGLGGALYAGITAIMMLAHEEKDHTAEFLLTHPISRRTVVTQKLAALLVRITALNAVVAVITVGCVAVIGETEGFSTIALLFLSYWCLQVETAAITFGLSAFLRRNGVGIGLGLPLLFYFINLVGSLMDETKFLKYVTPFAYTDSTYIIENHSLDPVYLAIGAVLTAVGIAAAYWQYSRKDIA